MKVVPAIVSITSLVLSSCSRGAEAFSTVVPMLGAKTTALDVLKTLRKANALAPFANEQTGDNIAVVTGGNSGIGLETVRTLALAGMKVVLCTRNLESGEEAMKKLPAYLREMVVLQQLDLADLSMVKTAAEDIGSKYGGKISCIVNNAGVMNIPTLETTVDGLERTFGTNHVGHHLFTRQLLPMMSSTTSPRIVTLASEAHRFQGSSSDGNSVDWTTVAKAAGNSYAPWAAYGESKLANIAFAKRLQELCVQEGRSDVMSVSVHPGVIVGTNLWRTTFPDALQGFLQPLINAFPALSQKTIPQGAATTVYCALAATLQGGCYYSDCNVAEPTKLAENLECRTELWSYTEDFLAIKGFELPETMMSASRTQSSTQSLAMEEM